MSTIYIQRKSAVKPITGSIADTTNIDDKILNTYSSRIIDMLMNIAIPIGTGMDYYGTEAPKNYMFADGRELSRTEYAELFSVIGTTYGEGDGLTTFNLPDKRCRVTAMYKEGDNEWGILGQQKGSSWYSYTPSGTVGGTALTNAQLPVLTGTASGVVTWGSNASGVFSATKENTAYIPTGGTAVHYSTLKFSIGSGATHTHSFTGTAGSINVQQPTLVSNYIIKVSNENPTLEELVEESLERSY